MKKLIIALVLVSQCSIAQNVDWIRTIGGSENDAPTIVTTDVDNNIYTLGDFQGEMDFDPGPGTFNLTSSGLEDVFLQKLNQFGDFQWAISLGNDLSNYPRSMHVDALGNLFIGGDFQGEMDFDPGTASFTLTSTGIVDAYILKLDNNGDFLWVKSWGGTSLVWVEISVSDDLGNIYVTGGYNETVDFNPGQGTESLTSSGSFDIYLLKLDSNGDFIWVKSVGGVDSDYAESMAKDNSNNIYITGIFRGTVDFDPGANDFELTSNGASNIYTLKLNDEGEFQWANAFGNGFVGEKIYAITADNEDNIYLTGGFVETVDFDPGLNEFSRTSNGHEDVFILKLNEHGVFNWAQALGGPGRFDEGWSITTNAQNNVLVTGKFQETVDFDPGTGTRNLTSYGDKDIFILSLDTSGDYISAFSLGGPARDVGVSIAIDNAENIILTGTYRETADLNPGIAVDNYTSNGGGDAFILKLNDLVLGANTLEFASELVLFPNPTDGRVTIKLEKEYQSIHILVTNTLGQTIINRTDFQTNQLELEINEASGVYFIEITSNSFSQTLRIIKN